MGLGNHKRKMSISLSITLIFPHTMANLVQRHGRERESTTAYDMHPVTLDPRVQNAARAFMSKSPFNRQRYTLDFHSVYFSFCMFFSVIRGPQETLKFVCKKFLLVFTYVFIPCRWMALQAFLSLRCIIFWFDTVKNNKLTTSLKQFLSLQKTDFIDLIRALCICPHLKFLSPQYHASFPIMHTDLDKDNLRKYPHFLQIHLGFFLIWHKTPEVFTAPYQASFITLGSVW